jgi:hypothetical protein
MPTQAIPGREALTPRQLKGALLGSTALLLLVALPLLWMTGATKYFVLLLAVWLAVLVYKEPHEAISAGILYLLACNVVLPVSAFDSTIEPWQMYYWASGLLIITLAAGVRIGLTNLLRVPTSVRVFLLVAVLAAFAGLRHGGSFSYVSRQLYGSILLVVYFAIAYHIGDEELFLRRLRVFGLVCVAVFFVYYASIFKEYGFHKELTALGTLEGIVAILCVVAGLIEKKRSWVVSGLIILCVPLLLFARHAILTFVIAIAIALAMKASTKRSKLLFYSAAVLVLIPSIFPAGAEIVLERAMNSVALETMLPGGTRDVTSLMDRNLQLLAALDILQHSPLLGDGFGNELAWDSPSTEPLPKRMWIMDGPISRSKWEGWV